MEKPTQVPLQNPPQTPSSKPIPFLLILLMTLTVLLLSSTAYLAYQNMQLTKQIATAKFCVSQGGTYTDVNGNSPTCNLPTQLAPTPTATVTSLTTAGTKIYTNNQHGYTVQIPASWSTASNNPNGGAYVPEVLLSPKISSDGVGSRIPPCVTIHTDAVGDINTMIQNVDGGQVQTSNGQVVNLVTKIISSVNITVNNIGGLKRQVLLYGNSAPITEAYLLNGENVYMLTSCPGTDDATFEQILESFKTLSPPAMALKWKKYTNGTYHYLLSYPSTWQVKENASGMFPATIPSATQFFQTTNEFNPGIYIWFVPEVDPNQWITKLLLSPDFSKEITEQIVIGGVQGLKISGIPGPLQQEWVFLTKDSQSIIFYAAAQENFSIFDHLLGSFNFTQ